MFKKSIIIFFALVFTGPCSNKAVVLEDFDGRCNYTWQAINGVHADYSSWRSVDGKLCQDNPSDILRYILLTDADFEDFIAIFDICIMNAYNDGNAGFVFGRDKGKSFLIGICFNSQQIHLKFHTDHPFCSYTLDSAPISKPLKIGDKCRLKIKVDATGFKCWVDDVQALDISAKEYYIIEEGCKTGMYSTELRRGLIGFSCTNANAVFDNFEVKFSNIDSMINPGQTLIELAAILSTISWRYSCDSNQFDGFNQSAALAWWLRKNYNYEACIAADNHHAWVRILADGHVYDIDATSLSIYPDRQNALYEYRDDIDKLIAMNPREWRFPKGCLYVKEKNRQ